jgi:hypothetical protein
MKSWLAWAAGLMLCLPGASAQAADAGFALGFALHEGRVERTSIVALAQVPPVPQASARSWSLAADARKGEPSWRVALPPPRHYDTGRSDRLEFVVRIPAIAPDTRLVLRDAQGLERWSGRIDRATLARATLRGKRVRAQVEQMRAHGTKLARARAGSALHAQMGAAEPPASRSVAPESAPVAAAPGATPSAVHPQLAAAAQPWLDAPRSPLSIDADRARVATRATSATAPAKGATAVAIRVVDDTGAAPGQAFEGSLFRENFFQHSVSVDAAGDATLMLEAGGSYELDLPARAPLVAVRHAFAYSGTAPAPFVLERGWVLDVQLQDSAGAALDGVFYATVYGFDGAQSRQFSSTPVAAPGALRFALPRDTQLNHRLYVYPASATAPDFSYPVGNLAGDRALAVRVASGMLVTGQASAADGGAAPAGGRISCSTNAVEGTPSFHTTALFETDGRFSMRAPIGVAMWCVVTPPSPLLGFIFERTFQPGDPLNLSILRGVPVRFLLQDQTGQAPAGSMWGAWRDDASVTSGSCNGTPCELLLPADRPVEMSFHFDDPHYRSIRLPAQQYAADSEHVVLVQALRRVSGRVTDSGAAAMHATRTRVFDADGEFVVSMLGREFEFMLPDGSYRFEADPNTPYRVPGVWTYRESARSALVPVQGDVVLPDLALPTTRVEVVLEVNRPCGLADEAVRLAVTAPNGRRTEGRVTDDASSPLPRPPGQCATEHLLTLSPGDYVIDVAPFGWLPRRIELTAVAGAPPQRMALEFDPAQRTQVWRGTLRDAQGQPIAGAIVGVVDGDQDYYHSTGVDAQGRFELPFVPGWGVTTMLFGADGERAVNHPLVFGAQLPGPDLVLGAPLDLGLVPDQGLQRLYGDGNRERRLNILFVAEGYADVTETYTDSNGNGVWDGAIWYDLDASGVFESARDRIALRGAAPYPAEGSVPTAQNEPFTDLNGDGVPSFDDPALFVANAEAFMRSLLGWDFFREHRDAFNAWLMFTPSAQAGHDVRDAQGTLRIERDTRYDGVFYGADATLGMDRTAALEEALVALPEVDLVVALMQEPVYGGRANAVSGQPGVIVQPGGLDHLDANSFVPAHEMGHFVANLCDEYAGAYGVHPGGLGNDPPLECANATFEVDPARIPWRDALTDPAAALPTRDRDGRLGLFEGAVYFHGGAYRPSFNSTMRANVPFFNAPSREALAPALRARSVGKMTVFASGFE